MESSSRQFAKYGFDGMTMEKLAQAAKITKRTLYKHYPTKEELYAESSAWHIVRATDYVESGNTPEEKLRHYLKWLLRLVEQDVVYRRLVIQLIEDSDANTLKLIADTAQSNPVSVLSELIARYKPSVDPLKYAIAIFSIALLHEQSKKVMTVLAPEFRASADKKHLVNFFIEMLN